MCPLCNMQNLFLFSAEYQSSRIICWNINLYFFSVSPVNPWRWLTVEIVRGSCLFWGFFGFLLLCFLGAGGEKEHGKERWWSGGGWKVNWFPGSGKSGGEQDQGFCKLWEQTLHSLTLLWEVLSRWKVFLQKLGFRHWDFLPPWLFSCPKGDIEAELSS